MRTGMKSALAGAAGRAGAGLAAIAAFASPAWAAPTQEDVFRSIEQSVGESVDTSRMLALLACSVGVLIILALINQRMKRQVRPKPLNHQKRLFKEVSQRLGLRPAEIKRIRQYADDVSARRGEKLDSPIVLMLCPSLSRSRDQSDALSS